MATRLKQNGVLAAEKAESVNSSWELQDLAVDENDPYVIRAIGVRTIRRKAPCFSCPGNSAYGTIVGTMQEVKRKISWACDGNVNKGNKS